MRPPSPLTPHLFVQVWLKIFFFHTSSYFLPQLKIIPAGLYLLSVDASNRINEVSGMYDNSVRGDVVYTVFHTSVWGPVIGVDFCFWSDTLRDYGIQCRDIPPLYNLEVTTCWTKVGSDYAKYPSISGCSPSSVKLSFVIELALASHLTAAPGPPNGMKGLSSRSLEHTSCSRRYIFDTRPGLRFNLRAVCRWESS